MRDYFTICTKVSLGDLFFVIRPNQNMSAYNRINRKHVDFVLCDPKTMQPRLAVELDDKSHSSPDRQERDEFVDSVFQIASLPLVHVPARLAYSTEELSQLFKQALHPANTQPEKKEALEKTGDPAGTSPVSTSSEKPLCPKCGIPMVVRTAKKGINSGKLFYGCSNYPKCQEIAPFSEP